MPKSQSLSLRERKNTHQQQQKTCLFVSLSLSLSPSDQSILAELPFLKSHLPSSNIAIFHTHQIFTAPLWGNVKLICTYWHKHTHSETIYERKHTTAATFLYLSPTFTFTFTIAYSTASLTPTPALIADLTSRVSKAKQQQQAQSNSAASFKLQERKLGTAAALVASGAHHSGSLLTASSSLAGIIQQQKQPQPPTGSGSEAVQQAASSGELPRKLIAADLWALWLYTTAQLASLLLSGVGGKKVAVGAAACWGGGSGKDRGTKCQLERMLLAARMGAMVLLLTGTFGGHQSSEGSSSSTADDLSPIGEEQIGADSRGGEVCLQFPTTVGRFYCCTQSVTCIHCCSCVGGGCSVLPFIDSLTVCVLVPIGTN